MKVAMPSAQHLNVSCQGNSPTAWYWVPVWCIFGADYGSPWGRQAVVWPFLGISCFHRLLLGVGKCSWSWWVTNTRSSRAHFEEYSRRWFDLLVDICLHGTTAALMQFHLGLLHHQFIDRFNIWLCSNIVIMAPLHRCCIAAALRSWPMATSCSSVLSQGS